MPSQIVPIPSEQQQRRICASCQSELRYALISDQYPHLYCTHCHNAYVEASAGAKAQKIWWQHIATREQHEIQGHAPVCECGGLFLFNAQPHCTHCGRPLDIALPTHPKRRLLYSELVIFNGAKVYRDAGTIDTYQFA